MYDDAPPMRIVNVPVPAPGTSATLVISKAAATAPPSSGLASSKRTDIPAGASAWFSIREALTGGNGNPVLGELESFAAEAEDHFTGPPALDGQLGGRRRLVGPLAVGRHRLGANPADRQRAEERPSATDRPRAVTTPSALLTSVAAWVTGTASFPLGGAMRASPVACPSLAAACSE